MRFQSWTRRPLGERALARRAVGLINDTVRVSFAGPTSWNPSSGPPTRPSASAHSIGFRWEVRLRRCLSARRAHFGIVGNAKARGVPRLDGGRHEVSSRVLRRRLPATHFIRRQGRCVERLGVGGRATNEPTESCSHVQDVGREKEHRREENTDRLLDEFWTLARARLQLGLRTPAPSACRACGGAS